MWQQIGRHFKDLKLRNATPNECIFFAGDRFTMLVTLEKASITDHKPLGGTDANFDLYKAFADATIQTLDVRFLKRVGNRYLFTLQCKSRVDAIGKLQQALPRLVPTRPIFAFEPKEILPSIAFEGDDGDLGCHFKIYYRENKIELEPPPEALAQGLEKIDRTSFEIVLDLDLFTRQPLPVESFEPKA